MSKEAFKCKINKQDQFLAIRWSIRLTWKLIGISLKLRIWVLFYFMLLAMNLNTEFGSVFFPWNNSIFIAIIILKIILSGTIERNNITKVILWKLIDYVYQKWFVLRNMFLTSHSSTSSQVRAPSALPSQTIKAFTSTLPSSLPIMIFYVWNAYFVKFYFHSITSWTVEDSTERTS